jgi:hypothetical protein
MRGFRPAARKLMCVCIHILCGAGLAFWRRVVESLQVHQVASRNADRHEAMVPAQKITLNPDSGPAHPSHWLHLDSFIPMARFDEQQYRPDRRMPQTKEQSQAWDHVARVFGRRPCSIRCISGGARQANACIVKLEWSLNKCFEFICAGGLLVGIPPKKPWQK